jgi:hypothetical protein
MPQQTFTWMDLDTTSGTPDLSGSGPCGSSRCRINSAFRLTTLFLCGVVSRCAAFARIMVVVLPRLNMRAYFAIILFGLVATGCGSRPSPEQKALDTLLTNSSITQIADMQRKRTNWISGPDVQKFLTSLSATNRAYDSGSKAQFESHFVMLSGNTEVGSIDLFEDGTWEFGSYVFHLKH